MTEQEFLLNDRIAKIKSMNEMYDLEHNAYISFSGGKDSTVLSKLIDIALPGNQIPRVYINTGIEYLKMVQYIERERERDGRIVIVLPKTPIIPMLREDGYPFKSKEHSCKVSLYQNNGVTKAIEKYLLERSKNKYNCPKALRYQFTENFKMKISDKCCTRLKKEPGKQWAKENHKTITITGMRSEEGGQRRNKGCSVFKNGALFKFHPLMPVSSEFIDFMVKTYNIELMELYGEPYNLERTGCVGCPFALNLQEELDMFEKLLPNEKKRAEAIWKPVYDEYRRIGYRLKS